MDQNEALQAAMNMAWGKGDIRGAIGLLIFFAKGTGARVPRHLILLIHLMALSSSGFRDAVVPGRSPAEIAAVFDATDGGTPQWESMYRALETAFGFSGCDELADCFLDALRLDDVRAFASNTNPYLPALLALIIRHRASSETMFRLIDAGLPLLNRANPDAQFGAPAALLTSWGSHGLVLGLLRAVAAAGVDVAGKDVLDLGCGSGLLAWYLPPVRTLVGIDIDQGMLDVAAEQGAYSRLLIHDAREPAVITESDLVLSAGVFQFFDSTEHERVFRFCAQNLRPGGHLALVAPSCSEHLGEVAFNSNNHALSDELAAAKSALAGLQLICADFVPVLGTRFRLFRKMA